MKLRKNYKLYGFLFICFATVAVYQSMPAAKEEVALYEMEKSEKGDFDIPAPAPAPKPKTDPWVWPVRIGGVMTGVKTMLDIVDKLKKRVK